VRCTYLFLDFLLDLGVELLPFTRGYQLQLLKAEVRLARVKFGLKQLQTSRQP
jgi:hypothetical protein